MQIWILIVTDKNLSQSMHHVGRQQHKEACCRLTDWLTYSSKKAWNNFWHFSANSSFTISPAFSAVAVATSILKHRQTGRKSFKKLQETDPWRSSRDRHTQHAAVLTTRGAVSREKRDTWSLARRSRPISGDMQTFSGLQPIRSEKDNWRGVTLLFPAARFLLQLHR